MKKAVFSILARKYFTSRFAVYKTTHECALCDMLNLKNLSNLRWRALHRKRLVQSNSTKITLCRMESMIASNKYMQLDE